MMGAGLAAAGRRLARLDAGDPVIRWCRRREILAVRFDRAFTARMRAIAASGRAAGGGDRPAARGPDPAVSAIAHGPGATA